MSVRSLVSAVVRIGPCVRMGLIATVVVAAFSQATAVMPMTAALPEPSVDARVEIRSRPAGEGRLRIEARSAGAVAATPSDEEIDYVYRAGLHDAATRACSGADYAFGESLAKIGPEISMAWMIECGRAGHWRTPGERAAEAPLAQYIDAMVSHVGNMEPVAATRPGKITIHVPSPAALVAAYHHDLASKEGHRALHQQRMMAAAAVARMRQSGAFSRVDVAEYDDPARLGAVDGLVLAPRPWQLTYVIGGEPIASFNPATQWEHYMIRPVSAYEDRLSAAADSANMFAFKVAR